MALRGEIPRVYADMAAQSERRAWRGYSVIGIASLSLAETHGAPAEWRRALRAYREAATNLCGTEAAGRSWVALVNFPRAVGALQGEAVVFLARTPGGWHIWAKTVASQLPRADSSSNAGPLSDRMRARAYAR